MAMEKIVIVDQLDNAVATVLVQSSTSKDRVVELAVAGASPADVGLGNMVVVTPNPDGSWDGRFPAPRTDGTWYWWAALATSPAPTAGDGWVAGDYVAPSPYAWRGASVATSDVWVINTASADDRRVTFTLVSATTNAPSGAKYSWTFGDGGSSYDTSPTHWYATDGTYTVRGSLMTATGQPIAEVERQVTATTAPHYNPVVYSPVTGRVPPRINPASWVYADHHAAAVHPQSATAVAELGLATTAYPTTANVKGVVGMNQTAYAFTYYQAGPSTPRYTLTTIDPYAVYRPDNFTGPKILVDVPIPPGAVGAAGGDASSIIHDPYTDKLWEFWQFKDLGGGNYQCYQGGRIDDFSKSYGVHKSLYGVSATGLTLAPLMITPDDLASGQIRHAMYLGVSLAYLIGAYAAPANRGDGSDGNRGTVLKEGMRFIFPANIDLTGRGLTPLGLMIAEACKAGYPLVVCDRTSFDGGGAMSLESLASLPTFGVTSASTYSQYFGSRESYDQLGDPEFPWAQLVCVAEDFMTPADWPGMASAVHA